MKMIPIRHASHDRLRYWRFRDRVDLAVRIHGSSRAQKHTQQRNRCSSVDATISKSGEFRFGLIGVRNHGDRDPDQRSNRQASRRVALSKSWTDYSVAVNTPVYAARL